MQMGLYVDKTSHRCAGARHGLVACILQLRSLNRETATACCGYTAKSFTAFFVRIG